MDPATTQLLYALKSTLMFSLVTLGVYIAVKVCRFPDLTGEGGFGLSAIVAAMAYAHTKSFVLAGIAGGMTGMLAGMATSFLANTVALPTILASVLTMTMSVSIGLLCAGQAAIPIPVQADIFGWLAPLTGTIHPVGRGVLGAGAVLCVITVCVLTSLRTGTGFVMRLRGENPLLASELGHSLLVWDMVGLSMANGLVGLGAVLVAFDNGTASSSMGRGVVILALASIMLGEAVFPARRTVYSILGCFGGMFILQLVRLFVLSLSTQVRNNAIMPVNALDLFTSVIVIVVCWLAKGRGAKASSVLDRVRL